MVFTGFINGVYRFSEIFSKFVLLNLLWLVLTLPSWFTAFNILIASPSDRLFFIIVLGIFMPINFFPVTLVLFSVVRRWIVSQDEHRVFQTFIMFLKAYYKKGLMMGLVFTLLWSFLAIDIYYFTNENRWISSFFILLAIFLFIYTINFFCASVHYELPFKQLFNKALLLTIGNPIYFAVLFITAGSALLITIYFVPVLLILCLGSLIAYLSFSAFYRYYEKAIG